MKHFNREKWLQYKNNELKVEEKIKMEDHLYRCDLCMEIFLGSMEDEEISRSGTYISDDFTKKTMEKMKSLRPMASPKKAKKDRKVINDFFLYYTAVASVAIILTAGGFFGTMVDSIPNLSIGIEEKNSRIKADTVFNISENIAGKASDFINNFEIKKIKED